MTRLSSIRKLALGLLAATAVVVSVLALTPSSSRSSQSRTATATQGPTLARSAPRSAAPALAVRFDDRVHTALHDYAMQPASAVALDAQSTERGRTAMRSWATRSLDLATANRRESSRFARTSFTASQAQDVPMHLSDRLAADGTFASEASAGTARVVYRESSNGLVTSFHKLDKDQARPTGPGLAERDATTQAHAFLTSNHLIEETRTDVIARTEVRGRRVDQEAGQDFLVQQDIVVRRTFEGKPVINSSAVIGVLPAGNEIVSLEVNNWVSTSSAPSSRTAIKPALDATAALPVAADLEAKLANVINHELGADAKDAIVRDVEEGWFVSERDGLIPALVFSVQLADQTVAVAMTPYHDSAQIWEQGRKPRLAAGEPDFAVDAP